MSRKDAARKDSRTQRRRTPYGRRPSAQSIAPAGISAELAAAINAVTGKKLTGHEPNAAVEPVDAATPAVETHTDAAPMGEPGDNTAGSETPVTVQEEARDRATRETPNSAESSPAIEAAGSTHACGTTIEKATTSKSRADQPDHPEDKPSHYGYVSEKKRYISNLRRIEGQVRGIAGMVENEEYCIDILTQVTAATAALHTVALKLMNDHLSHCLVNAAAHGDPEEVALKLQEATRAISRLMKS